MSKNFPALEAAKSALEAKQDEIAAIFEEAGDDYDLTQVKSLGDVDVVDHIRNLNDELPALKANVERLTEVAKAAESVRSLPARGESGDDRSTELELPGQVKSIGEQVVASDAYKRLLSDGFQGRKFTSGPINVKATMTTVASPVVQPQVAPGVVDILFNRLTVADLIPQATTSSSMVRSIVETTATNAASAVAEDGLKPESTLILDEVDERVAKIATILRASDEMLDDLGWVTGYINGRGTLFVKLEEEDQLLNGNGTAPNLSGILDRSGLVANIGGGINPDSIHNQITVIRSQSFLEPDALVIHPSDWETLRLSQDLNEQYYAGGPFTGAYGNNGMASNSIWGLNAVVTPAIAEGTALVGAFRTSAQIFRRTGVTVDVTNTDGEDWRYNRVAFRFEERLALAVYRPQGFGTVTTVV